MNCKTTLEKSFYALDHKTGALIIGVILSLFIVSSTYYSVEQSNELFELYKLYENNFERSFPLELSKVIKDSVGMLMFYY